jgi:hypothetical protein
LDQSKLMKLIVFTIIIGIGVTLVVNSDLTHSTAAKKKQEPYALLMGSCFNEKGFSLPGVTIVVEMKVEPGQKVIRKKWELFSSPRGEFAVRLPAGVNTFLIGASKKGYKSMEKTVIFTGDERQDVLFKMETLSEQQ